MASSPMEAWVSLTTSCNPGLLAAVEDCAWHRFPALTQAQPTLAQAITVFTGCHHCEDIFDFHEDSFFFEFLFVLPLCIYGFVGLYGVTI